MTIKTCNKDSKNIATDGFWNSHNDNIFNLLNEILEGGGKTINHPNVAVLGAGSCNDIPLNFLAENFNRVDLYDIDWEAINEAKNSLSPNLQKKIRCNCLDITGLFLDIIPSIVDNLKKNQIERCVKLLQDYNKHSKKYLLLKRRYDVILSINVVTQLLRPFFDIFIESCIYIGVLKNGLLLDMFKDNIINIAHNTVPDEHLQFLKLIAKPNAKLLVTTDKFEWGWLGERKSPVNDLTKEPSDMLNKNIQELLISKGLQLNGSTIESHYDKLFKLLKHSQWLWHFNEKRTYLVDGFVFSL